MLLYIYLFLNYWFITNVQPCAANVRLLIKKVDFIVTLDRPAAYGCSIIC
jgi:hypothetical protein